ncbi:hypothetical protein Bca52824_025996 [Brassica carinata]|uniref:Uncharacterized protein n=1 Tax=Brassica carinata TaxID=52824 RepID=A0A8X7SFH1_BRACI|nr:hypothetical protein Bca52824_025996 [Brassica carinata]
MAPDKGTFLMICEQPVKSHSTGAEIVTFSGPWGKAARATRHHIRVGKRDAAIHQEDGKPLRGLHPSLFAAVEGQVLETKLRSLDELSKTASDHSLIESSLHMRIGNNLMMHLSLLNDIFSSSLNLRSASLGWKVSGGLLCPPRLATSSVTEPYKLSSTAPPPLLLPLAVILEM